MIARATFSLPPDRERLQKRAISLEWISVAALVVISAAMFAVMGSSQAMKTAWVEDVLSLIPPLAYLIAVPISRRAPNEAFPYGYQRAISIAFLCGSLALFTTGAYLLGESLHGLIAGRRPTIPSIELFGWHVWQGWPMIAVLAVTSVAPVILGRKKLPLACELHDKALHTDAEMNKADWLTAIAGVLGILGVALGFWWADAVAAAFISVEVTRDGIKNLNRVVKDIMDRAPTDVKSDAPHELRKRLTDELGRLDWVKRAGVRLREEGHVLCGEAFLVPADDEALVVRLEQARELARSLDWRLFDLVVTAVPHLPRGDGSPVESEAKRG